MATPPLNYDEDSQTLDTASTEPGEAWTEASWMGELVTLTPWATAATEGYGEGALTDLASPQSSTHRALVKRNHQRAKLDLARNPKRRKLAIHPSVRNVRSFAPDSPSPATLSPWTPRWYAKELALRKSPTVWPPKIDGFGRTIAKYAPPKPDSVERRAKRIDAYERENKVMTFMRRFYRDLDAACKETTLKLELQERLLDREITELLRVACVWELYTEAPKIVRAVYDARIDAARDGWYRNDAGDWDNEYENPPDGPSAREELAESVLYMIEQQERHAAGQRAYEFIKKHGMFMFVVGAHSHYFRSWIVLGMDDPVIADKKAPDRFGHTSQRIDELLGKNRFSIEMFVRSRNLDWKKLLPKHKQFFKTFNDVLDTATPFEPESGNHRPNRVLMTLRSRFQRKKHWLTDWEHPIRTIDAPMLLMPRNKTKNRHPHEFVLGLDGRTVFHPQTEVPAYLTQKIVAQGGFRKQPSLLPKHRISPESDKTVLVDVKIIDESFLAPDYVWPNRDRWPIDDPRYRSTDTTERCRMCHQRPKRAFNYRTCPCTLSHLQAEYRRTVPGHSSNPLIELRQYPVRGIGVRVLQPLYKGDILAEYVGEMYPDIRPSVTDTDGSPPLWAGIPNDDKPFYGKYYPGVGTTYHMCSPLENRNDENREDPAKKSTQSNEPPVDEYAHFIIDASVYGNWVRYINHSCNASALFELICIGGKLITAVVMVRDVEWGEELTVNYGEFYWNESRRCQCGEANCISRKSDAMTFEDGKESDIRHGSWQTEGEGEEDDDDTVDEGDGGLEPMPRDERLRVPNDGRKRPKGGSQKFTGYRRKKTKTT